MQRTVQLTWYPERETGLPLLTSKPAAKWARTLCGFSFRQLMAVEGVGTQHTVILQGWLVWQEGQGSKRTIALN